MYQSLLSIIQKWMNGQAASWVSWASINSDPMFACRILIRVAETVYFDLFGRANHFDQRLHKDDSKLLQLNVSESAASNTRQHSPSLIVSGCDI